MSQRESDYTDRDIDDLSRVFYELMPWQSNRIGEWRNVPWEEAREDEGAAELQRYAEAALKAGYRKRLTK